MIHDLTPWLRLLVGLIAVFGLFWQPGRTDRATRPHWQGVRS
jgi:hypothetical protein